MTYSLDITDIAEEDILSAARYIANVLKAPAAANKLLDEIEKYEEILENTPNMYPFVSDEYLAGKGLKFVMVKNYIMLYTVNEDEKKVSIIRFLHSRRDWRNMLKGTG
ncbi:MAG: type II toxin-antitoxin system RelE/ParE family toxin [Clostridiales bacterium]|nr:type II toxin-antitoxin system RelE/ParE family toxin [Clostridiales bacterium]